MNAAMDRRTFLRSLGALAMVGVVPRVFVREALADPAVGGPGPYGPLLAADANGIMLPAGFSSRELARGGSTVAGTGYTWHIAPDGGATFRAKGGGWIYVSNSERSAALS